MMKLRFFSQLQSVDAEILKVLGNVFTEDEKWLSKVDENVKLFQETKDLNILNTHMQKLIGASTKHAIKELDLPKMNAVNEESTQPTKHKLLEVSLSQEINMYLPCVKLERLSNYDIELFSRNKMTTDVQKTEMLPPSQPLKRTRKKTEVKTERYSTELNIISSKRHIIEHPKVDTSYHNSILQEMDSTIINADIDSEDEIPSAKLKCKKEKINVGKRMRSFSINSTNKDIKVAKNNNTIEKFGKHKLNSYDIEQFTNVKVLIEKLSDEQINLVRNKALKIDTHISCKEINIRKNNVPVNLPTKTFKKPLKVIEPMFNIFGNSPVKKRIEAFEKLKTMRVSVQTRVTRTKTRAKEHNEKFNLKLKKDMDTSNNGPAIPVPAELTPPTNMLGVHKSAMSSKTAKALKACREEYHERERRRKAKEEEYIKKKEIFKKAQAEDRKHRREQKEIRARELAKELERDKLGKKMTKATREKENKNELRINEMGGIKKSYAKNEEIEDVPIYMLTKPPLLPTHDCYDSDDPNANDPTKMREKPTWTKSDQIHKSLKCMQFVSQKLKRTFFCMQPETPDLRNIFKNIDPIKLQRNSSAIWKNIPRFTLMPLVENNNN